MSDQYCIFRGQIYPVHLGMDQKIKLISDGPCEGFEPYIDVLGKAHFDCYMKIVNSNEVELLFSEEYFIKYCGEYFEPFAGCITGLELEDNSMLLFTPSEQLAKKFNFTKDEQFVFKKVVSLDDVDEIKIVKKPILMFSDKKATEDIIKKADIKNWLATRKRS